MTILHRLTLLYPKQVFRVQSCHTKKNFTHKFYCLIGCCVSSIFCDISMFKLTSKVMNKSSFHISLYTRYVYDIFLPTPKHKINHILDWFYNFLCKLQFVVLHINNLSCDEINFTIEHSQTFTKIGIIRELCQADN